MSIKVSIGTPTANSYVSVAYANTYFETREYSQSWSNILTSSTGTLGATERKERLLRQATRELDRNIRFNENKYYGGDLNATDYQALEFPRTSCLDANSDLYIPYEVMDATCEQALWILERAMKKTTNEGVVVDRQTMSPEGLHQLRYWANRQVDMVGSYSWDNG